MLAAPGFFGWHQKGPPFSVHIPAVPGEKAEEPTNNHLPRVRKPPPRAGSTRVFVWGVSRVRRTGAKRCEPDAVGAFVEERPLRGGGPRAGGLGAGPPRGAPAEAPGGGGGASVPGVGGVGEGGPGWVDG